MNASNTVAGAAPASPTALLRLIDGWLANTGHGDDHPWRLSIGETLSGGMPDFVVLAHQRVDLARDAIAEIRAISQLLRCVLATEPEELTAELLARGMLARVQALADAAADALDPAGEPVDSIATLVTCRAAA